MLVSAAAIFARRALSPEETQGMNEKRRFARYQCFIKIDFDYYEGNPDEIDILKVKPIKGKGQMLDLSRGGAFIVSNTRVGINMPLRLRFQFKKMGPRSIEGTIVRTGLLKNNPSEIAKKFAGAKVNEDAYIAVKFNEPIEDFSENDLA